MTDLVPLRQTTVWGGFRESKPIPHRYGVTGGELLQYDQVRRLFVWADHTSEGIDEVLVNGVAASGWAWRNGKDTTGKPVTFVEFISSQDEGVTLLARGRGKLHANTGARMTNPATVLWDLLANICGRDLSESALDRFKIEADALGIEVSGSIEESISIQSQCREICSSIGAIFSPDTSGLARIYPGDTAGVSRETIDYRFTLNASANRSDISNAVIVNYAFEAGQPTKSIELEAPDSIARYGRAERTMDAKWVSAAHVAHGVAERAVAASARPSWQHKASGIKRTVRVGDTITVDHPVSPYSGAAVVLSVSKNFAQGTSEITFDGPMGQLPRTRIVRQSEAFTANALASVSQNTVGNERLLELKEQNGAPIDNAAVTLDGQTTRYTDASGKVTFPVALMQTGTHTLKIVTKDSRELSYEILVP